MTHKVCACFYTTGVEEIYKKGIYILDRKHNTVVVLNKKLQPVKTTRIIIASDSYGCIWFNLNK